jgi:hypothetical protein
MAITGLDSMSSELATATVSPMGTPCLSIRRANTSRFLIHWSAPSVAEFQTTAQLSGSHDKRGPLPLGTEALATRLPASLTEPPTMEPDRSSSFAKTSPRRLLRRGAARHTARNELPVQAIEGLSWNEDGSEIREIRKIGGRSHITNERYRGFGAHDVTEGGSSHSDEDCEEEGLDRHSNHTNK